MERVYESLPLLAETEAHHEDCKPKPHGPSLFYIWFTLGNDKEAKVLACPIPETMSLEKLECSNPKSRFIFMYECKHLYTCKWKNHTHMYIKYNLFQEFSPPVVQLLSRSPHHPSLLRSCTAVEAHAISVTLLSILTALGPGQFSSACLLSSWLCMTSYLFSGVSLLTPYEHFTFRRWVGKTFWLMCQVKNGFFPFLKSYVCTRKAKYTTRIL